MGTPRSLDIDLLRSFALIAEGASFTRAAERVGRTQAAVSLQVQRLEALVGQRLFERSKGAGVLLTPEGRALLGPARELLALNDGILGGSAAGHQSESASRVVAERASIAVLPFQNMSGDPGQDYFVDGVVDDIAAALSRIKWLVVTARGTTSVYKGVDPRQAGRDLGVRYLLQGGVRRSGSRVRVATQMIEAETGNHLWSDRYDCMLEDVFDLQDQIAAHVAGVAEPGLRKLEIERAARKPTENLDAYDLYLRALPHVAAQMPAEARKALPILRAALEMDPGYAAAEALVAWCHELCFTRGGFNGADRDAALAHARSVIASDTDDGSALAVSGFVTSLLTTDYELGLSAIERGILFNPASATALFLGAQASALAGHGGQAEGFAARALELSPFDTLAFEAHLALGEAALMDGRPEDAAACFAAAARAKPNFSTAYIFEATALALAGKDQRAEAAARRGLDLEPEFRSRMFHELGLAETLADTFSAGARRLGLRE